MPAKKRTDKKAAKQFGEKLGKILDERGIRLDELVGPELRFQTLQTWRYGNRLPRARGFVELAKRLEMTPAELIDGVDVPFRIKADVEAIARAG